MLLVNKLVYVVEISFLIAKDFYSGFSIKTGKSEFFVQIEHSSWVGLKRTAKFMDMFYHLSQVWVFTCTVFPLLTALLQRGSLSWSAFWNPPVQFQRFFPLENDNSVQRQTALICQSGYGRFPLENDNGSPNRRLVSAIVCIHLSALGNSHV